jgi:hypothetical protein
LIFTTMHDDVWPVRADSKSLRSPDEPPAAPYRRPEEIKSVTYVSGMNVTHVTGMDRKGLVSAPGLEPGTL